MTPTEKAIRDFCGHHADWWPSTTQVQEMLALAMGLIEVTQGEDGEWLFKLNNKGMGVGKQLNEEQA